MYIWWSSNCVLEGACCIIIVTKCRTVFLADVGAVQSLVFGRMPFLTTLRLIAPQLRAETCPRSLGLNQHGTLCFHPVSWFFFFVPELDLNPWALTLNSGYLSVDPHSFPLLKKYRWLSPSPVSLPACLSEFLSITGMYKVSIKFRSILFFKQRENAFLTLYIHRHMDIFPFISRLYGYAADFVSRDDFSCLHAPPTPLLLCPVANVFVLHPLMWLFWLILLHSTSVLAVYTVHLQWAGQFLVTMPPPVIKSTLRSWLLW